MVIVRVLEAGQECERACYEVSQASLEEGVLWG